MNATVWWWWWCVIRFDAHGWTSLGPTLALNDWGPPTPNPSVEPESPTLRFGTRNLALKGRLLPSSPRTTTLSSFKNNSCLLNLLRHERERIVFLCVPRPAHHTVASQRAVHNYIWPALLRNHRPKWYYLLPPQEEAGGAATAAATRRRTSKKVRKYSGARSVFRRISLGERRINSIW